MDEVMERMLNILVIDDEQIVLDSIKKHLRKENCIVHTALSAQRALTLLDTTAIDVVLTDLMMPEIDGLECMKRVKNRSPFTPVIMITGFATINTALQAMKLGAFDYIAKPFTKTELLSVIQRAADLVCASESPSTDVSSSVAPQIPKQQAQVLRAVGAHSWTRLEDDGLVLMGVKRSFIDTIGRIQNVFLPSTGDELRQGSVYLRIFSTDLRSHTVLSPLSGTVVTVNEKVVKDPVAALEDRLGQEWLIRLKPSKFEFEIKELEV